MLKFIPHTNSILFLLGLVFFGLNACSGIQEISLPVRNTSTLTVSYSCSTSYTDYYNTLTDCEGATAANCTSEWKTFASGGVALCYKPVAGWEACLTSPAQFIYTPWSSCTAGTGITFERYRSTLGCSSTVCACTGEALVNVCVDFPTCNATASNVDCP
jgi:hypothetical protein